CQPLVSMVESAHLRECDDRVRLIVAATGADADSVLADRIPPGAYVAPRRRILLRRGHGRPQA
ncbi:MAG TPA: hypothetical protein VKM54_00005, partial [Myxococcota bacterium]|nr:hypothetical protein [Myxococcota bacterium]